MSNELFAEHLGIGVRTVANWHQKPTMKPRSEIQQLLDTALEKAAPSAKTRFSELTASVPALPIVEESAAQPRTPGQSTAVTAHDRAAEQAWRRLVDESSEVVELAFEVALDVQPDGQARLSVSRELLNLSSRPMSRLRDSLWFEHTQGPLRIAPVSGDMHRVAIHRMHETVESAVFACLISPPIRPGESGVVGYTCEGSRFVDDHYWRQMIARHTRRFSISLHHQGATRLINCTATEEHPDGSESLAEDLEWDDRDGAVDVKVTRHYLRPSQAVTLRWEVAHAPS